MIQHAIQGCSGLWRRTRGRYANGGALFCAGCLAIHPLTEATLAAASTENRPRMLEPAGHHSSPGRGE